MATLTKYNSFKSMKQDTPANVKKTAKNRKKMIAELAIFVQLLSKAKAKATKA